VIARRRLLALLLALASFGIALAVGVSSGGSTEPSSTEGSKKISVAPGTAEAPRFEAAGALPALREKPEEPAGPTTPPVGPVEPPVVDPPPQQPPTSPPDTDPPKPPVVVD
jgi:hypothetical protein